MVGKRLFNGIKLLNYHKAIYMSKYLMLWHSIFNFVAPTLLSARDSHEFRERLNKALVKAFRWLDLRLILKTSLVIN